MMLAPLVVPSELAGVADKLTRAVREVAVLGAWPDDQPAYVAAPQAEAIATVLIGALHAHLAPAAITYTFRQDMQRRGRVRLGVAAKASAKLTYLAGFDFVLDFNWTYWGKLSPLQRVALVDHELTHCVRGPEGQGWAVASHDVEEFASIVERWGLWTPDLREFHRASVRAQIDLFATPEPVDA
jgi:hypothetical protein